MRRSPLGDALETGNFTKHDERETLRCSIDETSEVERSIPQRCPQVSYIAYTLGHRKEGEIFRPGAVLQFLPRDGSGYTGK